MPMMMASSDACDSTGAPGLVHNYLVAFGDDYCEAVLKGNGTLSNCNIKKDGDIHFNISIDIQGLIDSSSGYLSPSECLARPLGDPFTFPSSQLQSQSHRIFNDFAVNITEDAKLRPPMAANFINAASNFATILNTFLQETKEVFNCDSLQDVYSEFSDPVCTELVGSWGWFFSCLYLACYIVCCGGIPAACLMQYKVRWDVWEVDHGVYSAGVDEAMEDDISMRMTHNIQTAVEDDEGDTDYGLEMASAKGLYPSAPGDRNSVAVDMLDVYPTAGHNATSASASYKGETMVF
jgi:hypothetical protein